MKKLVLILVAMAAVGSVAANNLITQPEALVSGVLNELKFESVPGDPKLIGAPPKFKVTKKTVEHLDKLMKDGKIVEIQGNGSIKILEAARK